MGTGTPHVKPQPQNFPASPSFHRPKNLPGNACEFSQISILESGSKNKSRQTGREPLSMSCTHINPLVNPFRIYYMVNDTRGGGNPVHSTLNLRAIAKLKAGTEISKQAGPQAAPFVSEPTPCPSPLAGFLLTASRLTALWLTAVR